MMGRLMKFVAFQVGVLALILGQFLLANAVTLKAGDIIVAEDGAYNEITKIDPVTGEMTLICTTALYGITDLAVSGSHTIYIIGYFWHFPDDPEEAIVAIDPQSCQERTMLTDPDNIPYGGPERNRGRAGW